MTPRGPAHLLPLPSSLTAKLSILRSITATIALRESWNSLAQPLNCPDNLQNTQNNDNFPRHLDPSSVIPGFFASLGHQARGMIGFER